MPSAKRLLAIAAVPAVLFGGYTIYILAGGGWGRELIKAIIGRVTARATYVIDAGGRGGDCSKIGNWDAKSLSCTMFRDVGDGETIMVVGDGVTLDGAGRSMSGTGAGRAVTVIGTSGVTIKGLSIEGYETGVYVQYSTRSTITNLLISKTTGHSIRLSGQSDFNAILNNDIGPSEMHGIALWSSNGNLIANNRIVRVVDGIRLESSDGNVILLNEIREAEIEDIDLHQSNSNRTILNHLYQPVLPILDDLGDNLYSLGSVGNFYSKLDSVDGGCVDSDGDALCDTPYSFVVGADRRPLVRPLLPITGAR